MTRSHNIPIFTSVFICACIQTTVLLCFFFLAFVRFVFLRTADVGVFVLSFSFLRKSTNRNKKHNNDLCPRPHLRYCPVCIYVDVCTEPLVSLVTRFLPQGRCFITSDCVPQNDSQCSHGSKSPQSSHVIIKAKLKKTK